MSGLCPRVPAPSVRTQTHPYILTTDKKHKQFVLFALLELLPLLLMFSIYYFYWIFIRDVLISLNRIGLQNIIEPVSFLILQIHIIWIIFMDVDTINYCKYSLYFVSPSPYWVVHYIITTVVYFLLPSGHLYSFGYGYPLLDNILNGVFKKHIYTLRYITL